MEELTMKPVGVVHGTRKQATDDRWLAERAEIELDAAQCSPEALAGLDAFSHGVREFGPRGEVRQPDWMTELMKDYY